MTTNVDQFETALNNPALVQHVGGGNACVRPYEARGDAIGICTGPFDALDHADHLL